MCIYMNIYIYILLDYYICEYSLVYVLVCGAISSLALVCAIYIYILYM